MYYLVLHDRRQGTSSWEEFEHQPLALQALREKEAAKEPHEEVVLFMADSLDELKRTHGRFFMGVRELFEQLGDERALRPTRTL